MQRSNLPQKPISPRTLASFNFELPRAAEGTRDVVIDMEGSPIARPGKAHVLRADDHTVSPAQRSASPSQARSHTSSPTLVRSPSAASTTAHSPVMRSMFPRYDPKVAVTQQKYYPTIESGIMSTSLPDDSVHRPEYSPSLYSQLGNPSPTFAKANMETPSSAHGSAQRFPSQTGHEPGPALSTPEELMDMWSIANGQESHEAAEIYVLGLTCNDLTPKQEILSFASSSTQALYIIQADASNLLVTRAHPVNPTPTIVISTPTIAQPDTTKPLIAYVFPKLAELMALDQSSSIAASHKLDRKASSGLQAEGIKRAQAQEAASLLWDSDSENYYLVHPTLNSGLPVTFTIELQSERSSSRPDIIRILTPIAEDPSLQRPLVTFSISSKTLIIHTTNITPLKSLYILDTLLSSLLVLLLHLHRHTSLLTPTTPTFSLAPTLNFPPPPTLADISTLQNPRSKSKSKSKPQSRKSSAFSLARWKPKAPSSKSSVPTLPDQHAADDVVVAAMAATALLDKTTLDLVEEKNATKSPSQLVSTRRRTPSSPDIAIDIDLEQFQPFAVDDPSLPRGTRVVLRALYWLFGVLVWALGLLVSVLAAGVVGVGALVRKL